MDEYSKTIISDILNQLNALPTDRLLNSVQCIIEHPKDEQSALWLKQAVFDIVSNLAVLKISTRDYLN